MDSIENPDIAEKELEYRLRTTSQEVHDRYLKTLSDIRTKRAEETKVGIPDSVSIEEKMGILDDAEESVRTNGPGSKKIEGDEEKVASTVGDQEHFPKVRTDLYPAVNPRRVAEAFDKAGHPTKGSQPASDFEAGD